MTTFAEVKQTRTYKRKLYNNFKIEGHMISPKFLVSALQCSVIGLENSRHTLHERQNVLPHWTLMCVSEKMGGILFPKRAPVEKKIELA